MYIYIYIYEKPTYNMMVNNGVSPAIGPLEFWEAAAFAVPPAGGTGELSGPSGGCFGEVWD